MVGGEKFAGDGLEFFGGEGIDATVEGFDVSFIPMMQIASAEVEGKLLAIVTGDGKLSFELALGSDEFSNFVYLLRILYNRICRQETYEPAEIAWKEKRNNIKEYSSALDVDGIFARLGILKQGRNKWLYNFLTKCQQAFLSDHVETVEEEIKRREIWLKGETRSRTVNKLPSDIQDWFTGGELDYRYGNAKMIMNDIFESEAK